MNYLRDQNALNLYELPRLFQGLESLIRIISWLSSVDCIFLVLLSKDQFIQTTHRAKMW